MLIFFSLKCAKMAQIRKNGKKEILVMKYYKDIPSYPLLRRAFKSFKDLGQVINRSASYVNNCMNGRKNFTALEKAMILSFLGVTQDSESMALYFPEV